jgi:NADH-quinone oxidoreductase subunit N
MNELPDEKDATFPVFIAYCVGSCLILFGCSLLYGAFGVTDISLLANKLAIDNFGLFSFHGFSFLLIVLGLFTKMLFFPFQGVYTEITEKIRIHVFAFLNFLPRFLCLAVILRLSVLFNMKELMPVFLVIGYVVMAMAFTALIFPANMKNIFAYNSIGITGLLLVEFAISYTSSIANIFFYMIMSAIVHLIFMACMLQFPESDKRNFTLQDPSFIRSEPSLALVVVSFCLLNITNMPPFPGFIPLVIFLKDMISEGAYISLIFTIVARLISGIAGIKIIIEMIHANNAAIRPLYFQRSDKTMVVLLGMLLILFTVKSNTELSLLSFMETTLRCYGEFGF